MKAMIFAAGLGTRLKSLTNNIPKALVEIQGIPLLELTIRKLANCGCTQIMINVHHFAEKIIAFLQQKQHFGLDIHISEEKEQLLETGGGLWKVQDFFQNDPAFLIMNVDIVSDIDLVKLYNFHIENSPLATLAVSQRSTSRYFLFDANGRLSGWENTKENKQIIVRKNAELNRKAFSGIHVVNANIFSLYSKTGKFPINEAYLKLAENHNIIEFDHSGATWFDMGKHSDLEEAKNIDLGTITNP